MERNQDLSSLLSRNSAPSSSAAQLIQAEMDDLISQFQELEEQIRKRRIVLSPLRRMPPEILGGIFSFVLPEVLNADGRRAIVDLMLVCKTWHGATLSTHRLWGGLQIENIWGGGPYFENIVSWFNRSGDCPKTLSIFHNRCICNEPNVDSDSDNDDDDSSFASPNCDLLKYPLAQLLAEGPPLDRLSIAVRTQLCLMNVLDSSRFYHSSSQIHSWDSIRSLELYFPPHLYNWYEPPNPSDSIFLHLPSAVTSFRLDLPPGGAGEGIRNMTIPLHWTFLKCLTSFHLTCGWGGNQILVILQDCVNVETLTIDLNGGTIGPQNLFSSRLKRNGILLPKLQTLKLERTPIEVEILQFLVAPALVNLDITFCESWGPADAEEGPGDDGEHGDDGMKQGDPFPSLKFFLASNHNTILQSLRIRNASMDANDLAQTLRCLPTLTHLTLEGVKFNGSPFQMATYHTPGTPYLPQLEVLELLNISEGFPSCDSMLEFPFGYPTNRPPVPQLKQLTMSHKGVMSDICDCLPKLDRLEELGISISIVPPLTWSHQSP